MLTKRSCAIFMEFFDGFVRFWRGFPLKSLCIELTGSLVLYRSTLAHIRAKGVKSPLLMKCLYSLMLAAPVAYVLGQFNRFFCLAFVLPLGLALIYLYRSYRAGEYPLRATAPQ